MRIALLLQDLFFQGGQRVAANLACGFAARGHRVDVVVSRVHSDIQKSQPRAKPFPLTDDIGFHVLPHRRASYNVFALGRILKKLKPDVILPNVGHYNKCAVLAKAIYGIKAPIIYVEHCDCGQMPPQKITTSFRLARWFLHRDARVVAVCRRMRDGLVVRYGLPKSDVVCIYNPILDANVLHPDRLDGIHPRLQGQRPYSIVAAGALHEIKNFRLVIDAFSLFHKSVPESQLVIFGTGPCHDALGHQIQTLGLSSCVELAGFTNNLQGNLRCADLLVSGSRHETFGIVLVEALDAECDVVATDCPIGPHEVLQGGRLGQLVPMDDAKAMAAAIMKAYSGQYRPSRTFSRDDYVLSTALDKYEKLFMEVSK